MSTIDDSDDILVVREKSELDKRPYDFFNWQKLIKFRRVIPFPAKVTKEGGAFYLGKVRGGEKAIRLHFQVETGITLSFKGREWHEDTSVEIIIPFKDAEAIAHGILNNLQRERRKQS